MCRVESTRNSAIDSKPHRFPHSLFELSSSSVSDYQAPSHRPSARHKCERQNISMPSTLTYSNHDAAAVLVADIFAKPFLTDLVLQEGSQVR